MENQHRQPEPTMSPELRQQPELVKVYHRMHLPERKEQITEQGLIRYPEANLNHDAFTVMNDYRPEHLRDKGISRFNIYAHLSKPEYSSDIVEVHVDPKLCYVADEDLATTAIELSRDGYSEEARLSSERYWSHTLSLEDFLRYYQDPLEEDGYYLPKPGAPEGLPPISYPEVLIPNPVPPERLKFFE